MIRIITLLVCAYTLGDKGAAVQLDTVKDYTNNNGNGITIIDILKPPSSFEDNYVNYDLSSDYNNKNKLDYTLNNMEYTIDLDSGVNNVNYARHNMGYAFSPDSGVNNVNYARNNMGYAFDSDSGVNNGNYARNNRIMKRIVRKYRDVDPSTERIDSGLVFGGDISKCPRGKKRIGAGCYYPQEIDEYIDE